MRMLNGSLPGSEVTGIRDFRIDGQMFAPREFEWDEAKEARNFAKHGFLFTDILGVFSDPARVDYDVSRPEEGEFRRKTVGRIDGRSLLSSTPYVAPATA